MPVTIPCRVDLPHYDMLVSLDAKLYVLELRWNARDAAWFMSIRDEQRNPLATAAKVVVDFPLARRSGRSDLPQGAFFAVDTSNERRDPGETDLGERVALIYFGADELPVVV